LYAGVFLLAPFLAVRRKWRALPAKGTSAVYFAALGLGFMFYEITMIQRLVQFLGYPTYSLTVTLAAILLSTGVGALLSSRFAPRARSAVPILLAILAALTLFYELALPSILDGALLSSGLALRVLFAGAILIPLGLCLGMFMPLGLGRVASLTEHGEEYVAWGWAVNGFFSVIGSVLTTILSMAVGFRLVQFAALGAYAIAAIAFTTLPAGSRVSAISLDETPTLDTLSV
jgi:MFS family permease